MDKGYRRTGDRWRMMTLDHYHLEHLCIGVEEWVYT